MGLIILHPQDHSESGWLGRKQEEKAEPRGRLEALQSLEFCNETAAVVVAARMARGVSQGAHVTMATML